MPHHAPHDYAAPPRPANDAAAPAPALGAGLFPSALLGGFECSTHRRRDRRRLDLIEATRHEVMAGEDYAALAARGVLGARDGVRWHLVEREPGRYDWSPVLPLLRAARAAGVRVAWDLCHYGYPDHLDPWDGARFAEALARYAAAFARVAAEEEGEAPVLCPINEISYWAWAGAEVGAMNPFARGRGWAFKPMLLGASVAAARAAREAVPGTRLISAEPAINVMAREGAGAEERRAAEHHRLSQYEATDALVAAGALDVVGVNFYHNNQWVQRGGEMIPVGHPRHRPLREILGEVAARYPGLPLLVAETSIEGGARAPWLRHVGEEVRAAVRAGVPVGGLCWYPIADHPGWENGRYCPNGLFGMTPRHGRRPVHAPLDAEFARQRALFEALARGEAVPEDSGAAEAYAEAARAEGARPVNAVSA